MPLGVVSVLSPQDYYREHSDFKAPNEVALKGGFRLNPLLFSTFSGGNVNYHQGFLRDQDFISTPSQENNQVLVTWTLKGKYQDEEFTLLPKNGRYVGTDHEGVYQNFDTFVRVKNISPRPESEPFIFTGMLFGDTIHPFMHKQTLIPNIVSNKEEDLQAAGGTFKKILTNPNVKNPYLTFSLVNHLRSQGNNLYPFLEYAFETVDGSKIADRFYTLQGQGKVGQYHVKLQVKKPTLEQPALGNFTIIF